MVVVIAVAVVLGVAALAALAVALVNRRRLGAQRLLTSAAEARADLHAAAATSKQAELESATAERLAAEARAAQQAEQALAAEERASATTKEAEAALDTARAAEQRAIAAETAMASARDAAASQNAGIDPDVLWILEQSRSERTWRFSVAAGPDSVSVFAETTNPLLAALQVELDAAREDVGAVVELDAEIPEGLTVAATVLTLRAAQELLADVVRRSEETTLHVRADGNDLVLDVTSVDENGQPVLPTGLPIPPSPAVDVTLTGVRIRNAIAR